jgi:hypothetical protein
MSDFTLELKRFLLPAGVTEVRQGKGDHEIWYSPISSQRFVVDARIKSRQRHTIEVNACASGSLALFPPSFFPYTVRGDSFEDGASGNSAHSVAEGSRWSVTTVLDVAEQHMHNLQSRQSSLD